MLHLKLPWLHSAKRLIRHRSTVMTPLPNVPFPVVDAANPFGRTFCNGQAIEMDDYKDRIDGSQTLKHLPVLASD